MKADLAVRAPVKNVFEETRLDPAHGGSAFWRLLPRVLGIDSPMRVAPRRQTLLLGPPSKAYSKKLGWIPRTGVRRFGACPRECLVSSLIVFVFKMHLMCEENAIFAPEYFCGAAPSCRRLFLPGN